MFQEEIGYYDLTENQAEEIIEALSNNEDINEITKVIREGYAVKFWFEKYGMRGAVEIHTMANYEKFQNHE